MFAGLTIEEREALAEITRMGFPPRAWFNHERIARGYTGVFSMFFDNMAKYDPGYFEDFWTVQVFLTDLLRTRSFEWGLLGAAALVASAPILILYLVFERRILATFEKGFG